MLFALGSLADNPDVLLVFAAALVVAFVLGIGFHEFSHALIADHLGDHTPRRLGRLTLNPIRHMDPAGTALLVFVGFGWGKPVPVNQHSLRNGPRTGMAVVAAAGPLSNLLVAAVAALPIRLGLVPLPAVLEPAGWSALEYTGLFLEFLILINIILALFNFLPVAPLDGFKVALGILPEDMARSFQRLEPYGIGILMVLIMLPFVLPGVDILGSLIVPARDGIFDLLTQT